VAVPTDFSRGDLSCGGRFRFARRCRRERRGLIAARAEVLEGPASRNSAQPGVKLGLVSKLIPVFTAMEKRLLGDVFGAVASTERTAQDREVGEVSGVVVVKSVSYPHQYEGSDCPKR
jgi:hypothetical protein